MANAKEKNLYGQGYRRAKVVGKNKKKEKLKEGERKRIPVVDKSGEIRKKKFAGISKNAKMLLECFLFYVFSFSIYFFSIFFIICVLRLM